MNAAKKASTAEATAFLEGYLTCAKEMEIPLRTVCERLGEILSEKRQRASKYMPFLRVNSKRNPSKRKALESLESDGSTHRRAPHPNKGKKLAWWSKLSKEEKAFIIAKRVAGARAARKAKKAEAA